MSDHRAQLRWKLAADPNYGVIATHPVNIACGRKPEYPERTHDLLLLTSFVHISEALCSNNVANVLTENRTAT